MAVQARQRGDNARARELCEERLTLRRELGDQYGIANALGNLGGIALDQRDAACLEALAELCMSNGHMMQGVRLWGAAELLRQAIHAPLAPAYRSHYEQAIARARSELGEEAFTRVRAEGSQMIIEGAIAYALQIAVQ